MLECDAMFLLSDKYWEIKQTPQKGKGLFAKKDIQPGIVIGDYLGKVINNATDDTSDDDGLYLMYYHDKASIMPNKTHPGIHLINHSCQPNTWMHTYQGHTLFFTLRHIFPQEELTISYLLSPDADCSPCTHICICGKSNCTGTMHLTPERYDEWKAFSDNEEKQTKKKRIRYGKNLSPLNEYPQSIPDNSIYSLFANTEVAPHTLPDTKLPSLPSLRALIKETGRILEYPAIQTKIIGIDNNEIITEQM
jgi:hypothetical protein